MATVALPSPGTPLTLHGQLQAGKVVFDGPKRFLLSADATEALRVCWGGGTYVLLTHGVPCVTRTFPFLFIFQAHLEADKPLAVEVARYIQNDAFFDNVWEPYHGLAWIPASQSLLTEGSLELDAETVPLLPWSASAEHEDGIALLGGSSLPAYTVG